MSCLYLHIITFLKVRVHKEVQIRKEVKKKPGVLHSSGPVVARQVTSITAPFGMTTILFSVFKVQSSVGAETLIKSTKAFTLSGLESVKVEVISFSKVSIPVCWLMQPVISSSITLKPTMGRLMSVSVTRNGTVILFSSREFERRNSVGVHQIYLISVPLAALRSNF